MKNKLKIAIFTNAGGLVLSSFSEHFFSINLINKITYACYCLRTELIVLLFLLLLVALYPYCRKYFRGTLNVYTKLWILAILIFFTPSTLPELLRYAKARYYYFNNHLFSKNIQVIPYNEGVELYDRKQYEAASEKFTEAIAIDPDSQLSGRIKKYIQRIEKKREYSRIIYEQYVRKLGNSMTLHSYNSLRFCYHISPADYEDEMQQANSLLQEAIQAYPALVQAHQHQQPDSCIFLLRQYGWCWFERIVQQRLFMNNGNLNMCLLTELLSQEKVSQAQERIKNNWNYKAYE